MKRIILSLAVFGLLGHSVLAQETIALTGSSQNVTTLGFELNEYDYLIDPLHFFKLSRPWLFFALDNGDQFATNEAGYGFRAGWALGGAMTPVALFNFYDASSRQTGTEEANRDITRTDYDQISGTYATVTQSVDYYSINNRTAMNLVVHGGLSLSDKLAFALQFALDADSWNVARTSYTDTYSDTTAPVASALTTKGDLTQISATMRGSTPNSYKIDAEAGLTLDFLRSRIVLGLGFYNLGSQNNLYTSAVTDYNAGAGVDDTVRDSVTTTSYAGQYYYTGSPSACFNMNTSEPTLTQYTRLALGSDTVIPLGGELNLTVPLDLRFDLYPSDLQTVYTTQTISYDDASATSLETSRSTSITTTSLLRSLDLSLATGATLTKTFFPTETTLFHLLGGLDLAYAGIRDVRARTAQTHTQIDADGDGLYTTAGADTDTTYTRSGYEVQKSTDTYDITPTIGTSLSYSPVKALTFHAGASIAMDMEITVSSTLTTGDSGYTTEALSDALDPTNGSYDPRPINLSDNDIVRLSDQVFESTFSAEAYFGFTLQLSESFKLDAQATSGDVGFDEFSVLVMYSY